MPRDIMPASSALTPAEIKRQAELEQMAAYLRTRGATKCPTRFAAVSDHAVVVDSAEIARKIVLDRPPRTVPACLEWLDQHGYRDALKRIGRNSWTVHGRTFNAPQLCQHVNILRNKAMSAHGV